MWVPGNQKVVREHEFNEELLKIEGELDEDSARIALAKFLIYNIGFTFYLLSGSELLPVQEIIIKSIFKRDNGIIVAGRGYGKCKSRDSLCLTQNGMVELKDVAVGDRVFAKDTSQTVLARIDNPEEDGLYFKTLSGLISKVKIGHKFLVWDAALQEPVYRNAEDIKVGESLIVRKNMQYFPQKENIDNDFCYFLGLIIGDGHIRDSVISITNQDKDVLEFVEEFLSKRNIKYTKRHKSNQVYEIRVYNKEFRNQVYDMGIYPGMKSHLKTLTPQILSLNKLNIATVIKGLFDTDGFAVYKYVEGKNSYTGNIGLSSVSYDLLYKVKLVMLNLGINTKLRLHHKAGTFVQKGKTYNKRDAYSLEVRGYQEIEAFSREIRFLIKRKQENVNLYLANNKNLKNNDQNKVPGFRLYFKEKYKYPRSKSGKMFPNTSVSKINDLQKMGLFDAADTEKFSQIQKDIVFDRIIEITPIKVETIDIQVEKEECYWSDGFINHNSHIISCLSLLYPLIFFRSKMCLVSVNFRGSRRILEEAEKILHSKKAKLLKQCFPKDLRRGNDIYQFKLGEPTNSEVFALPLSSGDGLRGTRASFVCVDEGLLVTKEIQENVIRPFLTSKQNMQEEMEIRQKEDELIKLGVITDSDRISFPRNKYFVFSSASYKFQYLYELYQKNIENCINPSKDPAAPTYFVARFAYDSLPDGVLDITQIEAAKANGGENTDSFKREYRALFSDSADGYFNVLKLHKCTYVANEEPTTQIFGDKDSSYILSIDPSYAANKNSDYFAMGVYLLDKDRKRITLVNTYGRAGGEIGEHFEYFTYLMTQFNVEFVVIDASGTEFISGYNQSVIAKERGLKFGLFTDLGLDNDDETLYKTGISTLRKSYNKMGGNIIMPQQFSSQSLRRMNEHLQNQIEAEKVWFASPCQVNEKAFKYQTSHMTKTPYKFKNNSDQELTVADLIDLQDFWINETKSQVSHIEVKSSANGVLQYDLPRSLKSSRSDTRARRDHYTCLLMANWGAKIYLDMLIAEDKKTDLLTPIMIY